MLCEYFDLLSALAVHWRRPLVDRAGVHREADQVQLRPLNRHNPWQFKFREDALLLAIVMQLFMHIRNWRAASIRGRCDRKNLLCKDLNEAWRWRICYADWFAMHLGACMHDKYATSIIPSGTPARASKSCNGKPVSRQGGK
jgi:hypothetical protein